MNIELTEKEKEYLIHLCKEYLDLEDDKVVETYFTNRRLKNEIR